VPHGVEVDAKRDRHLTHGRHLVAGREIAGADGAKQLLAQLYIDRHTGFTELQVGQDSLLVCMHIFIQYGRAKAGSSLRADAEDQVRGATVII